MWITGGEDGLGRAVRGDEVFDPAAGRFAGLRQAPALPGPTVAPALAVSIPANQDADVATDVAVALRFASRSGRPPSRPCASWGPMGVEPADVVVAEGGRLAFIHPAEDLLAGAE